MQKGNLIFRKLDLFDRPKNPKPSTSSYHLKRNTEIVGNNILSLRGVWQNKKSYLRRTPDGFKKHLVNPAVSSQLFVPQVQCMIISNQTVNIRRDVKRTFKQTSQLFSRNRCENKKIFVSAYKTLLFTVEFSDN